MLLGLPRTMHPPHPFSKSTRDPIPREQQLLSLGKTDIHIVRHRRQRQRLRRLTQRTHQHPRRPSSAITSAGGIGTRAVRACAPGTGRTAAHVPTRVLPQLGVDDRKVLAGE
ncbi:hypothetical protein [Microbispora catharanthi]|uniref:hypothetical protein n=1 Tax=Microbispora catharanthi TaxID=1712871 RepID=UPI001F0E6697|nr:hypothetical protein [Microbispora catharanthi]